MKPTSRPAFTLIELLVVIAIVGVLIAIVLPTLQWAREATRQIQCQNHLKQMALGALIHDQQQGHLPTGGWSGGWTEDPDRGFGQRQPGGWAFNLLPFVEESQLHQLGSGQSDPAKVVANKEREAVPVSIYFCPSRRPPLVIGYDDWPESRLEGRENITGFAPMDYLANKGHPVETMIPRADDGWPNNRAQADNPDWHWPAPRFDGVIYLRSQTRFARISRGTSKTLLFGEKFVSTLYYRTNWHEELGAGGNSRKYYGGAYLGDTRIHSNRYGPRKDGPIGGAFGIAKTRNIYGSAHPIGLNVAMCDGSIRHVAHDRSRRTLGGMERRFP